MKFGTLLELNSNIEWWNHYVDYDALKKLFPSNPLDPSYFSTQQHQESSSLLPTARSGSDKWASPEEFRAALDRERKKVQEFYNGKLSEVRSTFESLEEEVRSMEERELGEDIIKEEDEEDEDGEREHGETDGLISPGTTTAPRRPSVKNRSSFMNRMAPALGRRRKSILPVASAATHEADLHEPQLRTARSRSTGRLSISIDEGGANVSPKAAGRARRSSDIESSDDGPSSMLPRERRTSQSSTSSQERDPHDFGALSARTRFQSLGLVLMDPSEVPDWLWRPEGRDVEEDAGQRDPVYIWTGTGNYGTFARIALKKKISRVWLDCYSLKQYVDLNLTAFEKILKKYDKNTNSKLKKDYVANVVLQSDPWLPATREALDQTLARILFLYRRVVVSGDEDLAKEQLRSQLREKVVVDRETVWSQMVSGRREQGIFRSVEPDEHVSAYDKNNSSIRTPLGRLGVPSWWSGKAAIFLVALAVMFTVVQIQPFDRVEESNCLAMLLFCTILWATEAIPLFVTSLAVPFLVVLLRVLRSSDEADVRLPASEATKYIFSQMFSPTIMLLIGGFTIAAVLSKTRLDVMTASRILNAAGSKPSVVLLVLMCVATFASMWISNVAAPTLCYALIKPITNELHPKSVFSKCLIIAIALASNIGGQASPISSPQNLIALGSMNPPLSWLSWFAISLPVATLSVLAIWAFLHVNYRWESDLAIPKMRKNTDTLSKTHYFVLFVSALTIALWCMEKSMETWVGDMGIIAIIPLLAFFGTGILSKEDFHSFHWSIVFLAMGGIALGKATLSSGLLDDLDGLLERLVEGLGLYSILVVFSLIALVIATFISHTIAAVLLVPIAERIGDSLTEPHPRLLIMATALICSAGMGLPVSGFPNMTAITQENKLGQRFIGASDFLKNGVPASLLATFVIVTVGYAIMRLLNL